MCSLSSLASFYFIIIIIIIIIIVVVVVVDHDTDYWVYMSLDHLFQVYYKVRKVLLQSVTASFVTKCDGLLLQSATAFLLQSATGITKCDNFITKCDSYYKVRQLLQSATVLYDFGLKMAIFPNFIFQAI